MLRTFLLALAFAAAMDCRGAGLPYGTARKIAMEDGRPLVVWVTAKWCLPCRQMRPMIERLEREGAFGNAILSEIDADRDQSVAAAMGVSTLPTFVRYDLTRVTRLAGRQTEDQMRRFLRGE
jgi:thioredoxin-like negative regulator of GroEL